MSKPNPAKAFAEALRAKDPELARRHELEVARRRREVSEHLRTQPQDVSATTDDESSPVDLSDLE